jgi:glucose-6-phosphate 1-epimerase
VNVADHLSLEQTPAGLTRALISTPLAEATVYLHGAHVATWTPRGHHPVLYLSPRSHFEPDQPIRGGVPICFPWFGPRSDGQPGPMHGFARLAEWTLENAQLRPGGAVELSMTLDPNDASRQLGFDAFHLRYRVVIGTTLEMELEVHNLSSHPFHFEEALHTYFSVGDINKVGITGLGGTTYIDKTDAFKQKTASERILITKETDQVHLDTTGTCEIADAAWKRTIRIEKSGSNTTVVWNPWIEKNKTLADMPPDDWQHMLCIETVNAAGNAVQLPPGEVHKMKAAISVKQ